MKIDLKLPINIEASDYHQIRLAGLKIQNDITEILKLKANAGYDLSIVKAILSEIRNKSILEIKKNKELKLNNITEREAYAKQYIKIPVKFTLSDNKERNMSITYNDFKILVAKIEERHSLLSDAFRVAIETIRFSMSFPSAGI